MISTRAGYKAFLLPLSRRQRWNAQGDERVEGLSLYDTALLMYGVLTCKEYFPDNKQIQSLSRELIDRVDWDWFVSGPFAVGPNANQYYLSWMPGPKSGGTFIGHVDGQTDEALMVDVLALGSHTHPVSFNTYLARKRVFASYPKQDPAKIMVTWKGSLFNYFFASCWLDFRTRGADRHPTDPCNLWENDKLMPSLQIASFASTTPRRKPGKSPDHFTTWL